jgi:type IV pilus assembly protein PilQ
MSNKKKLISLILAFAIIIFSAQVIAEEELVTLQVRDGEIKDVLVMLTDQSRMNLVPDETVEGRVTLNLTDVKLKDALETLTIAYGYKFEKINDNTYLVSKKEFEQPLEVEVKDNLLSIHISNGEIRSILKEIAQQAEINIIMDNSVKGRVSIDLDNVPLKEGLMNLLEINGFSLSEHNQIYRVIKVGESSSRRNLAISLIGDKVSIDVEQADISEILRTIAKLSGKDMALYGGVRERIDLKIEERPIEEAIDIILSGTRFTYKKVNGIYLIGDKSVSSPTSSLFTTDALLPLQYLEAEQVPKLLPNSLASTNIKVFKEQNAILVTGTEEDLKDLKKFIAKIDQKIPQIVVEALILDISHNEGESPKAELGINYDDESKTTLFDSVSGFLNYKSVLELPKDFYVTLQSLVNAGQVTVKANPNITTLNGQQARINVDTVEYYQVVKRDDDDEETIDYQSINTGVTLDVTPWVSSTGEITLKLNPTVSNPGTRPKSGPPNVNSREITTTVRVKDGETIVLGGLIRDESTITESKVPILGDIPLLGKLFRSSSNELKQTELVIYITPHVLDEDNMEVEQKKQEMLDKVEEEMEKGEKLINKD